VQSQAAVRAPEYSGAVTQYFYLCPATFSNIIDTVFSAKSSFGGAQPVKCPAGSPDLCALPELKNARVPN
jgi:hypothetical protein